MSFYHFIFHIMFKKNINKSLNLGIMNLIETYVNQVNFIQEEILWHQKSREKWVKLGDKNTASSMLKPS